MADSFPVLDLFIIGAGINGAGIARDASGRGLKVGICEQNDIASGTSSASSKLIHGGLRYLEHYEFRLVREALMEREALLKIAPHIIWPMRFVLPHDKHLRPSWMIRLGLFLYDHLAKRRKLPGSQAINLHKHLAGKPLKERFKKAFIYSDAWVDDARLVIGNLKDAVARGTEFHDRTKCVAAERIILNDQSIWKITLHNQLTGKTETRHAHMLVNAAGPWVGNIVTSVTQTSNLAPVRLIKGSHIVVPKCFEGDHAYIFQNEDNRIVFAIPYEQDFTLIGTTDVDYEGDPKDVAIDEAEKEYLVTLANRYFEKSLNISDIHWHYSGLRPLYDNDRDNPSQLTRDYVLSWEGDRATKESQSGEARLLNIFGGKITTYRKLAEHALLDMGSFFPDLPDSWTDKACLPGGDFPGFNADKAFDLYRQKYDWLPETLCQRYLRQYGTEIDHLIGAATSLSELGNCFGADLYQAELDYLKKHEWVHSGDDALFRRTKLGIRLSPNQAKEVDNYLSASSAC